MRIISFITLPSTVERILLHLDLPRRPPRVSPARGPPQAEIDLDQSPAFDLAAPEPIPELPPLRSGEPAGYLLCSSTRDSARTGSSSISPPLTTGIPEARKRPHPPLAPGRLPPPIATSSGPRFPWRLVHRRFSCVSAPPGPQPPPPITHSSAACTATPRALPCRRLQEAPPPRGSLNRLSFGISPVDMPSMDQLVTLFASDAPMTAAAKEYWLITNFRLRLLHHHQKAAQHFVTILEGELAP
jgi:hypothetical protein